MHSFYAPNAAPGAMLELDEEESRHLKVLRLAVGDELHLLDGLGGLWLAKLSGGKSKRAVVAVVEQLQSQPKPDYHIAIAIAPTKNSSRFEWFVEKAVELGVHEIVPMQTERTERPRLKADRLQKIALSAMKQSGRLWLPNVLALSTFQMVLDRRAEFDGGYMGACIGDLPPLKAMPLRGERSIVLIGPEGDFSPEEVQRGGEHGYKPISLGNNRLRVETAGIAACHILQMANE